MVPIIDHVRSEFQQDVELFDESSKSDMGSGNQGRRLVRCRERHLGRLVFVQGAGKRGRGNAPPTPCL